MLEVSESTLRFWPSSASAKKPRSAIQKSLVEPLLQLLRLLFELARPSAGSLQTSRARRAVRRLAS